MPRDPDDLDPNDIDPDDIPDDENVSGGPIADKGGVAAPMHHTERPADGPGTTPGVSPDALERLDDDGEPHELDFESGRMDEEAITNGESVIEAEYEDRGPAQHLDEGVDPSAAADIADMTAGDRLSGTDLETDADTDPLPPPD